MGIARDRCSSLRRHTLYLFAHLIAFGNEKNLLIHTRGKFKNYSVPKTAAFANPLPARLTTCDWRKYTLSPSLLG